MSVVICKEEQGIILWDPSFSLIVLWSNPSAVFRWCSCCSCLVSSLNADLRMRLCFMFSLFFSPSLSFPFALPYLCLSMLIPWIYAKRTLPFHTLNSSPLALLDCIGVWVGSIIYLTLYVKWSQTWWLKITTTIISQFLWVRIPAWLNSQAHNTAACSMKVNKL